MKVQQLVPQKKIIDLNDLFEQNSDKYPIEVFDPLIIEFSNNLSKKILRNPLINRIPAYVALAYWLRKSNIKRIILENTSENPNPNIQLSPLGTIFHVCPSNVDTMFIYSLFVSLLSGNKNILRISTRTKDSTMDLLFSLFGEILSEERYQKLKGYIRIFSYERSIEINSFLSRNADGRVIWGGDETVKTFRQIVENPRSKDLVFADRQSLAIFKTETFLKTDIKAQQETVRQFFNDAYSFDQKGCSSPQIVITYGSEEDKLQFREKFYAFLEFIVSKEYEYDEASLASLKLNQLANDAVDSIISSYYGPNKNLVIADLQSKQITHTCGGGYFYLKNISNLTGLKDFVHKKVQTITYYGLSANEKKEIFNLSHGKGVERLVPIGKGLSFDYIWDGYNLVDELITKKYIE